MPEKKKIYITVIIILFVAAIVVFGYLLLKKYRSDFGTDSGDGIFSSLTDSGKKDYKILYGKNDNTVTSQSGLSQDCRQFTLNQFLGGGIVNRDGSDNKGLKINNYPIGNPSSDMNNNYYYISSKENPVKDISGISVFDWDLDEQTAWSADYNNMQPREIISSSGNRFPGGVETSPDNEYLVYMMTEKKENKFSGDKFNEKATDSTLVIRNIETGEEKVALQGNYNRQLFDSFLDFSAKEDALFTIAIQDNGLKFVKVMLDTGEVKYFDEIFAPFDWKNTKWDDLFAGGVAGYPAYFDLSSDETKLMAYKNYSVSNEENYCIPAVTHKIWSFNIKDNTIDTYDEGSGIVSDLKWKNDSKEFAFTVISGGGCYPEYLDSSITKIDRDGQNREVLIVEEKSKMTNLSYAPDDTEIVYDVYGTDFVSYLKSLDIKTKETKKIISTRETEGSINKDKPVTLHFLDWVVTE